MTEHPQSLSEARPRVYVVALGWLGTENISGVSCDANRVWFQHISSTLWYLKSDCTTGFPDRRYELEQAYPDGFDVVLIGPDEEMPDEIKHHFEKVANV